MRSLHGHLATHLAHGYAASAGEALLEAFARAGDRRSQGPILAPEAGWLAAGATALASGARGPLELFGRFRPIRPPCPFRLLGCLLLDGQGVLMPLELSLQSQGKTRSAGS
jgi:hypothetical protein